MEGLFALLIIFLVLSALGGLGSRSKRGPRVPSRRLPTRSPTRAPGEPTTIRDLLEEFRRSMEEAERKARGEEVVVLQPPTPVEEIEDRTSLEIEPVEASRPVYRRPEPVAVDFDEEAEAVIERRLRWAEEQAKGLTPADHRAFDEQIRKPAPRPAAPAPSRAQELRKMIVWREVLGPPVALRKE